MTPSELKVTPNSRTVAKERRRLQLIKSTINSISKRGIAGTTMADVTRDAGLSLGIVNLHFQSKEKLFEETLLYLSDEYEASWVNALKNAGDSPAEKLTAMVKSDFSTKVCERKKVAVWFAFWGEAKSRPTYLHTCAQSDKKNTKIVAQLCEELAKETNNTVICPKAYAIGLAALTNGLWLDILMTPGEITRKEACSICFDYLAVTFPDHFNNE